MRLTSSSPTGPAAGSAASPAASPNGSPTTGLQTIVLDLLLLLPAALAFLILGAHFLRAGHPGPAAAVAALPLLLLLRRRWVARLVQLALAAGALVWVQTGLQLTWRRLGLGLPWGRMAAILTIVAAFTVAAALLLETRRLRARYAGGRDSAAASGAAFLLTAGLLALVQLRVSRPLLLADRLVVGAGWVEALVLAVYAALLVEKLFDPRQSARWRERAWILFSVVFFAQLALGLLGREQFLMTGTLHWPIPALIVAGPIYRAAPSFMLVLFASTTLLVGPAWCSHLCYLGAWDHLAARQRRKPVALPRWRRGAQAAVLAVVVLVAAGLRLAGAGAALAGALALTLGLGGVALMLLLSRRRGAMVHCVAYCPIGALAGWLGRLAPFRVRIAAGCDDCGRCRLACRYDALNPADIARRRPASSCTLCGDCLASCSGAFLEYRCLGLRPARARAVFLVLVVALHAATLGLARI